MDEASDLDLLWPTTSYAEGVILVKVERLLL